MVKTKKSTYQSGKTVSSPPKKQSSKADSAVTLVTDRFKRARNQRTNSQDQIWERSYKNWKGEIDTTLYPWRSKLFIPWSFTVIETTIPKVFAREPKWRALARRPEEADSEGEDPAQVANDLLTYQWKRAGMRLKMYDFIKDSLMYSKGYVKITWKYIRKNKQFMEAVVGKNDEITFEAKIRNDLEYDDPEIEVVDPADIYVDPDSTKGPNKDSKYVIHRTTKTIEDLKNNPNYSNVHKLEEGGYSDQYEDKLYRYNNEGQPTRDEHSEEVEILEYWGADDRLIVIADRSVVLRDSPNPFWHKLIPFVELDDYRDPHKYYGQSELSVIDPLQREINSIRNQRRDYDNLQLNPVILMVPGTVRNPKTMVMAPGAVWNVSDLQSIDFFQLPPLQGVATDIEQQTVDNIKIAVAIDEIGIGLLPENPQRRSATEVVTAQTMAGKRISMKIAMLEEAVKEMGQIMWALNQQFIDQERVIQIVGEDGAQEWLELGPEDVRADFLIDLETGSMLPKDEIAQRQEAVELLQYITPIISPVIPNNPLIIMPIIKMVLDTFELPGKKEIIDELKKALGIAKEVQDERNMAEMAMAEASAVGAMEQVINPPETAQGRRADQEVDEAASAG